MNQEKHFSLLVTPPNTFAVGKLQEESKVRKFVNPKWKTTIRVGLERSTGTTSEFRTIYPEKRHCFYPGERQLDLFRTYSEPNCVLECAWKRAAEACGCAPLFLADHLHLAITTMTGGGLCEAHGNLCFRMVVRQRYDLKDDDACLVACMHDCEFVEYSVDISNEEPNM